MSIIIKMAALMNIAGRTNLHNLKKRTFLSKLRESGMMTDDTRIIRYRYIGYFMKYLAGNTSSPKLLNSSLFFGE